MPTDVSRNGADVASLAIVIATAAVIGISNGLFTPLVSLKAEATGVSSFWNGALAGSPPFAILTLGLSYPACIRKLGMLRSFYLATAVAVAGALLFPVFVNYWVWILIRFVMGGALGLQWVVSESWVMGLAAGPRRGTILGLYVAVFSAGLTVGPLILSFIGAEGFLAFAVAAALMLLCGLALPFARLPNSDNHHDAPRPVASTVRIAFVENLAGFMHGARYGTSFALLPLYAIHLGSEPGRAVQLLSAMSLGSLIFQPISGRLIDRYSPRNVLLASAVVQLVFCALLAPAYFAEILLWPLMLVWGASGGAMYTAGITGLGAKFSNHDLPAATTGFTIMWEGGALAGPLLAGSAMQIWDPHGMTIALAVFAFLVVFTSLRAR